MKDCNEPNWKRYLMQLWKQGIKLFIPPFPSHFPQANSLSKESDIIPQ